MDPPEALVPESDDEPPPLVNRDGEAVPDEETAEPADVENEEEGLPELSTGDDSSTTSDDSDKGVANADEANERLLQATQLKEEGNGHFSKGEFDAAARSYRRGISKLKRLNKNNTGEEQVQGLLISLHNNLSMVLFKQDKFRLSVEAATRSLQIDPVNVKSLYRRAVARRRMGLLDEARSDLREAAKLDPTNTAVKKELVAVKKQIETARESQKKALSKAFSGGGGLLYQDKETAQQRKLQEQKRQKELEQELYKQRKAEWEDECVSRMARNEPAITFEEYEKELKEKEEMKRKEEEKRRKEEEKTRKEEEQRRKKEKLEAKKAAQSDSSMNVDEDEDDSEHLSEKELAAMRGYKITADGKKTSYFTRELSVEERQAASSSFVPKRLDASSTTATAVSTAGPTRISPVTASVAESSSSSRPSAWNLAGTWEEKDTTEWCEKQLRKRLEDTSTTNMASELEANIVSVDELVGHSSVAFRSAKKSYIFEWSSKMKYEIKNEESGNVVASGVVSLPDICSTSHEEVEVTMERWSKAPTPDELESATVARQALIEEVRVSVQRWVNDFNQQY